MTIISRHSRNIIIPKGKTIAEKLMMSMMKTSELDPETKGKLIIILYR